MQVGNYTQKRALGANYPARHVFPEKTSSIAPLPYLGVIPLPSRRHSHTTVILESPAPASRNSARSRNRPIPRLAPADSGRAERQNLEEICHLAADLAIIAHYAELPIAAEEKAP